MPSRIAHWVALFSSLFVAAACDASAQSIKILKRPPQAQCNYNAILPSDEGKAFAIYRSKTRFQDAPELKQSDSFVLYSERAHTSEGAKELEPAIFGGVPDRLRPLAWVDGELIFRIGLNKIGRIAPHEGAAIQTSELPRAWSNFEIYISNAKRFDLLFDDAVLANATELDQSPLNLRKTLYISDQSRFSVVKRGSGQLLKVGARASEMETLGPASIFYSFFVNYDAGAQTSYFLGGHKGQRGTIEAKYARPIFDFSSGKVRGYFTPTSFEMMAPAEFSRDIFQTEGAFISHAAVNSDHVFLLLRDYEKMTVGIVDRASKEMINRVEICQVGASLNALFPGMADALSKTPSITEVKTGLTLAPNSNATGILLQSSAERSDRLVLYYHGGPAQSSNPIEIGLEKRSLLADGRDILMVEYSGSVGGGLELSKNLSSDDDFGFVRDAKALEHWLRTQTYKQVDLYAVSFGTLPALVFSKAYPSAVDRRVYVAPLLGYVGAEKIGNDTSALVKTVEGGQLDFELGIFGSIEKRQQYISFIRELAASYASSRQDLFVFGGADKKTPISLAPAHIIGKASILEVENVSHDFLPAHDETIDRVMCHLAKECGSL